MEHKEQSGVLVVDEALADAFDDGSARRGWKLDLAREKMENAA